jgi:hypothetical protein
MAAGFRDAGVLSRAAAAAAKCASSAAVSVIISSRA